MKRGFGKSIQLLSIFLAHATLFAQSTPVTTAARYLSRADTLEILEQVSSKAWNMIRPGDSVQLFPFDELTRDALRATLLSNRATTHPVWLRGEPTACPIPQMPDQHGPLAYVVSMRVSELKGETIAHLALGCGHGFAPGTAYSAQWAFKVRREKNGWIVGEPTLVYIT